MKTVCKGNQIYLMSCSRNAGTKRNVVKNCSEISMLNLGFLFYQSSGFGTITNYFQHIAAIEKFFVW